VGTLASGKKVHFLVASDLVHEVVLGIDILDNATLDLAHGLAVIPKLSLEGQLELEASLLSVNRLSCEGLRRAFG
jgi:hypothetical protein